MKNYAVNHANDNEDLYLDVEGQDSGMFTTEYKEKIGESEAKNTLRKIMNGAGEKGIEVDALSVRADGRLEVHWTFTGGEEGVISLEEALAGEIKEVTEIYKGAI